MKTIWQKTYKYLFFPAAVILVSVLAPFIKNIRSGFFPRLKSIKYLYYNKNSAKTILLHASSMGEFEHVRYLLQRLKDKYNTANIVTVFSPSAYRHMEKDEYLDQYIYMPLDTERNWQQVFDKLKPTMIVISKHDIWPMQIWTAKKYNIPVYLINASLAENSSRTRWYSKMFYRYVYEDITKIYTISEEDKERFSQHFAVTEIESIGDTKYDQVIQRKNNALNEKLFSEEWCQNSWIFVAGSIWPEDNTELMPALKNLLISYNNTKLILVPHQPGQRYIEKLEKEFAEWLPHKLSQTGNIRQGRVLIVDKVGLLADIYKHGNMAYVGGSFKQGIHNVMEPAVFGIPVIYGPYYENSYEAVQLQKSGGGFSCNNSEELSRCILNFYKNDKRRRESGQKAKDHSLRNTGTTEKLIKIWQHILD